MLRITALSKSYFQRGEVLKDLELEVHEADTVAITGPSGSGKTTLLNMIGLLDRPDSGDIIFRGSSILKLNNNQAAGYRYNNIGFVFQEHLLLPHLTIEENILLPVLAGKRSTKDEEEKIVYCHELMEMVGIGRIKDDFPYQVSGGEAQRASLVRALINKPSLILADEPTGSLDAANARILADLLVKINTTGGTSVITVTHSAILAEKMCRKFRLENGCLVKF